MTKDYYKTLGVSRDAGKEAIKKAYKKLAKQYHPDLNKSPDAEQKFKEINEAVSVLADDEKRAHYDQFGTPDGAGTQQGFDFTDFMRGFDFGQFGGGFDDIFERFFGGGGRRRQRRRGADLMQELEVPLEDAAEGATKMVLVNKLERCAACGGRGGEREPCRECSGHGVQTRTQRTPFGLFQTSATCRACGGEGSSVSKACKACHGEGRVRARKELDVSIPAGVDDGTQLRLRGEGIAPEGGGEPGDLYIVVRVKKHPIFSRRENDILLELPISFPQAVLGDSIDIPVLNGKAALRIPENTQNGTVFRMQGKGIRSYDGSAGDQLVKVFIKVPEKMGRKERALVEELGKLEQEKPSGFLKKFFR